jgi:23S rRNA pseudouridine2605 synthase
MKNEPKGGGERLQKVLARAGIASRRAAEQLITAGRVRVDGRVVSELGVRVDARNAKVEVDGRRLAAEPMRYVVLHKPRGVMCTLSDPEGRPTVESLLRGAGVRLVPVGRLDFNTSGVLLCTNDGDFASRLSHPSHDVPKEYIAKVKGVLDDDKLLKWRESIVIDGRATRPADVTRLRVEGDKTWISVRLKEGRNRQVRRLGEHTGFMVMRLIRSSHAGITAEGLRPGEFRELSLEELKTLKEHYGVPRRVHPPGETGVQHATGPKPRASKADRFAASKPERYERGGSTKPRGPTPDHLASSPFRGGAAKPRGGKPERNARSTSRAASQKPRAPKPERAAAASRKPSSTSGRRPTPSRQANPPAGRVNAPRGRASSGRRETSR